MHTIRLIYSSHAREGVGYRDFLAIMEKASETNSELKITGILCYGAGKFLQALEGERMVVNALYHHISVDERHAHCQLLSVEDIEVRDYAEWTMKVVDWSHAGSVDSRALLLDGTGLTHFDPDLMSAAQASRFLRGLAAAERELLE